VYAKLIKIIYLPCCACTMCGFCLSISLPPLLNDYTLSQTACTERALVMLQVCCITASQLPLALWSSPVVRERGWRGNTPLPEVVVPSSMGNVSAAATPRPSIKAYLWGTAPQFRSACPGVIRLIACSSALTSLPCIHKHIPELHHLKVASCASQHALQICAYRPQYTI
jgi:hypothetical protein